MEGYSSVPNPGGYHPLKQSGFYPHALGGDATPVPPFAPVAPMPETLLE